MSGRSSNTSKRGPKSKRGTEQYVFGDLDGTSLLLGLAIGIAQQGGALRIGLTRDGGALAIGVYAGSEYGTEYVAPNEDLTGAINEIADAWNIKIAVWDDVADRWLPS